MNITEQNIYEFLNDLSNTLEEESRETEDHSTADMLDQTVISIDNKIDELVKGDKIK